MTRRKARRKNGFALIVVIWGLGVISLLVVSFMTTGRLRLQAATQVAYAAQAAAAVEGATNLAVMTLMNEREARQSGLNAGAAQTPGGRPVYDGAPRFCEFAGAAVAVSIEDESGKVDVNTATPELLKKLMIGLGEDLRRADLLAAAIVTFRTAQQGFPQPASGGRPFGPKNALFQTVMELDQVEGFDAPSFRRLAPMLTVYSRSPGVNPAAAPPALFAALVGRGSEEVDALLRAPFPNNLNRADPRFPNEFLNQNAGGETFLIRAEALLPSGQASGREIIVDLSGGLEQTMDGSAGPRQPFAIKEIHRAASRYADLLRGSLGALRPC